MSIFYKTLAAFGLLLLMSCSASPEAPTCKNLEPSGTRSDLTQTSATLHGVKVGAALTCEESGAYIPLHGSGSRKIIGGRVKVDPAKGSPKDLTQISKSLGGVYVGTPETCEESGAYIPMRGSGPRAIVFGVEGTEPQICPYHLEMVPEGACLKIRFEDFSTTLAARLKEKNIDVIGIGIGICGQASKDPSTWNASVRIGSWRQADAVIQEAAALMNQLQIGNTFGISVEAEARGCSDDLENLFNEDCSEITFEAFSALLSARLEAKGIKTIGTGMGTCGALSPTKGDYSTWNLSVSVHDWRQADTAIEEAAALMNQLKIGDTFGISVRAIPCGISL